MTVAAAQNTSPVSRREARQAAMHVVFAALTGAADAAASVDGVRRLLSAVRKQQALSDPLVEDIIRVFDLRRCDIEQWMAESYARPLSHMTMVERAVIATAAAEMLGYPDTPRRVIINEAIEIAKQFGAEGGGVLVNGVLHAIAQRK